MNELGLQIKSFWDGDETVCIFEPKTYHTAIPGYVYGGLIASLIDCHSTGSAAAAGYRHENRPMDSEPGLRYLTASLHVDYLSPTPLGVPLEMRAQIKEIKGTKSSHSARACVQMVSLCARGKVVCVQVPEYLIEKP